MSPGHPLAWRQVRPPCTAAQVWAEMDREALGLKKGAVLDDVLVSDAFDRALSAARRAGAVGELNPQFYNYSQTPSVG